MSNPRYRLLLGIAALLAVLRLVVVPWIGSQAEAHERLQVLTQRLDRSVGVAQNREQILAAVETLRTAAAEARARFPVAASTEDFRLVAQRQIGSVATRSNLRVALFDWVLEGSVESSGLQYGRARFQMEGGLRDLAGVHAELEGALPNMIVRELQVGLRTPAEEIADNQATLTIVADLFFRRQEGTS